MKELSIEEKAKRYDEAVINGSRLWECGEITRGNYEYIFPELKESEGERIRKEIIDFIYDKTDTYELREKSNSWLAWLEKQGEQKPAWSEEDEEILNLIIARLHSHKNVEAEEYGKDYHWLKSLKDRVQPQKQEWSEEDESYLNTTIAYLKDAKEFKKTAENCINWLKSLCPQNHWKPSDEQLNALNDVISSRDIKYDVLSELWKDLKKLK